MIYLKRYQSKEEFEENNTSFAYLFYFWYGTYAAEKEGDVYVADFETSYWDEEEGREVDVEYRIEVDELDVPYLFYFPKDGSTDALLYKLTIGDEIVVLDGETTAHTFTTVVSGETINGWYSEYYYNGEVEERELFTGTSVDDAEYWTNDVLFAYKKEYEGVHTGRTVNVLQWNPKYRDSVGDSQSELFNIDGQNRLAMYFPYRQETIYTDWLGEGLYFIDEPSTWRYTSEEYEQLLGKYRKDAGVKKGKRYSNIITGFTITNITTGKVLFVEPQDWGYYYLYKITGTDPEDPDVYTFDDSNFFYDIIYYINETKIPRERMMEIVPGVAYDDSSPYYNEIPILDLSYEGVYTWEEVGLTDEMFEAYKMLYNRGDAQGYEYGVMFNGTFSKQREGDTSWAWDFYDELPDNCPWSIVFQEDFLSGLRYDGCGKLRAAINPINRTVKVSINECG